MILRARAPFRISFAGGGTDLSPFCDNYGGCVLSTSINRYIYISLNIRKDEKINITSVDYNKSLLFQNIKDIKFDGDIDLIKAAILKLRPNFGFDLHLRSDIPPNTGLGSSGAVAVCLVGILSKAMKMNLDKNQIAELAYNIETFELNNPGGRQDQYCSVYGGFNFIEFGKESDVKVTPLKLDKNYLLELEKHLILLYVGKRGSSGHIQKLLIDQQIKGDQKSNKLEILKFLKKNCEIMCSSLKNGDIDKFGDLLNQSWIQKRELSNLISNERIDKIYDKAIEAGALGGKITGAGGGGCMIFVSKSDQEYAVNYQMNKMKIPTIDFSFENAGLQIWEINR